MPVAGLLLTLAPWVCTTARMATLSRLKQPWQLLQDFLSLKIQFYMSAKIPETLESCTYFGSLGSASATNRTDPIQPKEPR